LKFSRNHLFIRRTTAQEFLFTSTPNNHNATFTFCWDLLKPQHHTTTTWLSIQLNALHSVYDWALFSIRLNGIQYTT